MTVSSTSDVLADDGLCTLREAVIAASTNTASGAAAGECPAGSNVSPDIIVLASGATYLLTIAGASEDAAATGDLDVANNTATTDLQIQVASGGSATISQTASPGDRILHVLSGAAVQASNVTFTNGSNTAEGGAINVASAATLTLTTCVVSNSSSSTAGGGIFNGGTLTLTSCTVSGNSSGFSGAIDSFGESGSTVVTLSAASGCSSRNPRATSSARTATGPRMHSRPTSSVETIPRASF